jgi:hypothetical protein
MLAAAPPIPLTTPMAQGGCDASLLAEVWACAGVPAAKAIAMTAAQTTALEEDVANAFMVR